MSRHRVAVVVRDGARLTQLGLVHQVFGQARSATGERLYDVVTCAIQPGPVRTDADFAVTTPYGLGTLTTVRTIVVISAPREDLSTPPACAPLTAALARVNPGTRVASICTGAFVLAAAGLLSRRRASTHPRATHLFRRRFPDVTLDMETPYVDDTSVLTSADEAAGRDMCLHMVRRDHGPAVSWRTAEPPEPDLTGTSMRAVQAWALDHLHHPVSLADFADRAALNVRTFRRQFRAEVGVSPLQWLIRQRIDLARRLLADTDVPLDEVATRAGFGSQANLRAQFTRHAGLTPSTYRAVHRNTALS